MLRRTFLTLTYTGPRPGGNIFSRMKLWNKYEPEITKREAAQVLGNDAPMSATHETPAAVPHGLSPAKRKAAIAAALADETPGVRASHATAAPAATDASVAGPASATRTATTTAHVSPIDAHPAPGVRKPQSWFDRAFTSPEFKRQMQANAHHPTAMTGADMGTTRAGMRSEKAAERHFWGNPIWGPAFLGVAAALLMYNFFHVYYNPPELDDAERRRQRLERLEELQQEVMFY